jgi:hypothetical protein
MLTMLKPVQKSELKKVRLKAKADSCEVLKIDF